MSTSIDNRVVSMQFDNQHFEKNVQTSLSTLDKLKRSLKLDSAAKGLENVSAAAKKFDMKPMGDAVETVRVKFSSLEVMAVTALSNITNSAVNAGKRLVSAFTIDPIKTGMSEYETQLNAVQTILANTQHKGTTLDQVNEKLDELNTYADQTIYNFTEMTRNIGTFTAAGVDLDKSVSAIKGIANLAAVSGSTSQQASTAMYQLSQALATGTVKLMDWNSVVNAGMGGKVFQDALTRTAAVMAGSAKNVEAWRKKNIDAFGSFRDSLTEGGWLTADVLTETLSQLSGAYTKADLLRKGYTEKQADEILELTETAENAATKVKTFTQLMDTLKEAAQSGWAQTWEILVGDFEQAKELWTGVSDVLSGFIGKAADNRNKLLSGAMTSNWDKLIKKVNEAGIETTDFEERVKKAAKAHDVDIDALIKKYGSLGEVFKSGAASSDILKEAVKGLGGATTKTVKEAENYTVKSGDTLTKIAQKYGTTVEAIAKANGILNVNFIREGQVLKISDAITETSESTDIMTESIGDLINNVDKLGGRELLIESFANIFKTLGGVIGTIGSAFRQMIPRMTSEQLYGLIESFHELTSKFKLTDKQSVKLEKAFKGLFAVVDIVRRVAGVALGAAFKALVPIIKTLGGGILDLASRIGTAAIKFREWLLENNRIADGFKTVAIIFKKVASIVKEWINTFLAMPQVQQAIEKIKMAFSNAFGGIGKYLSGGIKRLVDFINTIKSMDTDALKKNIVPMFKEFAKDIKEYFLTFDATAIFDNIKNAFANFKDVSLNALGIAGEKVEWVKEKLVAFVEFIKSKIPAAIAIGLGIGLIRGVGKLGKTLEILAHPIEGIKNILDGVADSFKTKMKAEAFEAKTAGIKNIAIAIGILAASLVALTLVDQKNLWSAVGAISVLVGVLVGLSILANKLGGIADLGGFAGPILALSGAVILLSFAIKTIVGIPFKQGLASVGILSAMMIVLVGVVALMSKFAPKLSTGSLTFITLAAAIAIMAGALKKIDTIEFDNLGQSLAVLSGIILGLAVLATSTRGVKFGSLIGIIGMVLGLKMMVDVMEDIAKVDVEGIRKNIGAIILVFGSVALLMASTQLAGKNAAAGGIGVLAMSAALFVIIEAIERISEMDQSTISGAVEALSKIMLVLGAVAVLSRFAGKNALGVGITMLAMSASLLVLVGAVAILKNMSPDGLDRAVETIGKLALIFSAMVIASKFAGDSNKTITAMTIAIGVLAAAVAALSFIEPNKLENATKSLSIIMGMFTLMIASTKLISGGMGTLIVMTGAVAVLAGVIYMLSALPVENVMNTVKSLSVILLTLSASCLMLSFVNPGTALMGVAGLATVLAGVGAIMAVIAGLNRLLPDMNSFLAESLPTLELLGQGLGRFFGGIVGGFGEGVTSSFPQIGTDLSTFMTNLKPFIDGASGLNASSMDGVKSIIDVITSLTAANFLEGITSFVTGESSITSFAAELPLLGSGLKQFSDSVVGIDTTAIESASTAVSTLATMASEIPNEGGLLAAIVGDNDMGAFATDLPLLGSGLKAFSDSVVGIDTVAIDAAATAASTLASMASLIPNEGGLIAMFTGDNDMGTFGSQLPLFGDGLKQFADKVTGIDTEAVTAASTAAQTLATMASTIPNEGGLISFFTGDNDMATFGTQLPLFADGIKGFADKVAGMDTEAVSTAVSAADKLIVMANNLPESGGLWSVFSADNDMSTFGSELKKFGQGISDFSDEVTGIDTVAVSTAATVATRMKNLAGSIPEGGYSILSTFGGQLNSFAISFGTFASNMSAIDATSLSNVIDEIGDLAKTLSDINSSLGGIKTSFSDALSTIAGDGVNGFISAFANSSQKIKTAAKTLMDNFTNGIKEMSEKVDSTMKTIAGDAADAAESKYDSFNTAGKYVATGFAEGISSNAFKAKAKAKAMAEAALQAAEEALGIASPSKEFYAAGDFSGMGFINALEDYVPISYRAGAAMAGAARNGLSRAVSKVSDLIFNGIDTQPTIRPVMDLSGVASGVGAANELIGGINPSVKARANIGMVSSMMNRNQNGFTNGDVVDAIDKLGRKLGNVSGNSYSIGSIAYDKGSDVADAIETLVRATMMERRR